MPKRKVRGPVATGSSICYVALHRLKGEQGDIDQCPKDRRAAIAFLDGTHIETEPSGNEHFRWLDWYAIPIQDGYSINDIARYLKSKNIHDGPYHGAGRVLQSTGSGAKPKHKPTTEARFKAMEKAGFPSDLLYHLFGDRQATVWLDRADKQEMRDYPLPACWDDDKVKEWFKLNKMNPRFHAIYCVVRQEVCRLQREMMTGQPYDELLLIWWQEREAIIARWIEATLNRKLSPTFAGASKGKRVQGSPPQAPIPDKREGWIPAGWAR